MFNETFLRQLHLDTNITKLLNWTTCSLQNIYSLLQKENVQCIVTSGDPMVWRKLFNLPNEVWLKLNYDTTRCASGYCWGQIT